ncbi:MAG: chemotaxis protein CheR, partial [Bacteroidetes bacterium RIFCSPLOWO2_02_FULL_36_8]
LFLNLKTKYGYDFTEYADSSIRRRVEHFMKQEHIHTFEELSGKIINNEEYLELFIQSLSVTVTEMFRDPSFYLSLREKVLTRLETYPVCKIWLAGCATGEEVFSMAILLQETGIYSRCMIYATDINQQSLLIARQGIYPLDTMKKNISNYIDSGGRKSFSEYFTANFGSALMQQSLLTNVVFSPHNLAVDKSFNEFQLIVCRNVLIYFNSELQSKVLDLFYESLCPLGTLALGNKESLYFTSQKNNFTELDSKEKIYIRKS